MNRIAESYQELRKAINRGPDGPVFRPFWWLVVPLFILAAVTLFVRLTNFDLGAQKAIYIAGGNSWDFGERRLWQFLYHQGTIPAGVACLLALAGYILGLFKEKWKKWRQCFLFVILLGVLGPGVITNLVLKEHWGRPRPNEIVGLGGQKAFEPVLTMDKSSGGKSFPCGHATMGYFFMGGFFLFYRYRKDWAWFFLLFGLCLGFFMGIARMCQGGHFFSDSIWAGGIVYFTAMGLYFALGLHRGIIQQGPVKPVALWVKVLVPVLGLALIGGLLLATPYREVRDYRLIEDFSKERPLDIFLILKRGTVTITPGDEFKVEGEAWGHGVPTSKVAVHFVEMDTPPYSQVWYKERMSGRFTEVDQNLRITLPWDRIEKLRIDASDCEVSMALPEDLESSKMIQIYDGSGDIEVRSVPAGLGWNDADDRKRFGKPSDAVGSGKPVIDVLDKFSGNLILQR
ncbi:MAG: phosphatase PAP2 family protein [Verrucomicrobiales bacterium]|nr:phosphatase PAP2 family protein [Verrucomicrobiales bacterium]